MIFNDKKVFERIQALEDLVYALSETVTSMAMQVIALEDKLKTQAKLQPSKQRKPRQKRQETV